MNLYLRLKDIQDFFNSLPQYRCPVCGGEKFTIQARGDSPVVRETMEMSFESDGLGGINIQPHERALPGFFIQSVCETCGHINAHNYMMLSHLINKK